jgi:hypothetical protein
MAKGDEGWEWVRIQELACPQCGQDAAALPTDSLAAEFRASAAEWRGFLESADDTYLRTNPADGVWSPMQYAVHVRDMLRVFGERIVLATEEDNPSVPWFDPGEDEWRRFNTLAPGDIADGVEEEADRLAGIIGGLGPGDWDRTAMRDGVDRFTVSGLARFALHESHHHLLDAEGRLSNRGARDDGWDYRRLEAAFRLAAESHRGQPRKGSDIPYLSHLLGVAELVMNFGGDDIETAAALLHDAVEDGGGRKRLEEIEAACGPEVARIVDLCSDSDVDTSTGHEKAPWLERKQRYIDHIGADADGAGPNQGALLVSACDKLHNLSSTVHDYDDLEREGWTRFKTGWSGQVWYYRELLQRYGQVGDELVLRVAEAIAGQLATLESRLRAGGHDVDVASSQGGHPI